ncbi:hypothetical protein EDB83DRAFT_2403295 [Lactarius deliciosus]|nr:hypothetical protein EDB83DRAFT_2403295 [Lactarius deliciosus]
MEDDEKSSFHGSLSRFAYVPLSSSFPPRHDQAPRKAQAACPIEEGSNKSSARQATLSRKREGDPERRRTNASSRKRNKLGDAAPDACTHLSGIPDCAAEDLDVLFCGINPGHMSAATGHHYANPTNHFWHCLHLSGFTQRLLHPSEDFTLPERYNLGLVNLVDRPSTSQAELSAQEMASSVPALLTKIARFRPRVVCFIGKGIWQHVERALKLKGDAAGNNNAGIREDLTHLSLGAHSQGQPAAKTAVPPKDGRSAYFHSVGDAPVIARPTKTEPECIDFCGVVVKLEESGSDVSSKVVETANATPLSPSSLPHSMTRHDDPRPASKKAKALPAPAFAYGLQPFKAVHDTTPHSASVCETLFCVFPSTSGRVVSHQRDDKVALFKVLRENLKGVKAGTLDTGSMRTIRLLVDSRTTSSI